MKNILITTLLTGLAFSASVSASNTEKNEDLYTQKSKVQFKSGGVITNLGDYQGSGFQLSARVSIPRYFTKRLWEVELYSQVTYQTSYDDSQAGVDYFDETELVVGLDKAVTDNINMYLEIGDLIQNFATDNNTIWKNYGSVYRIGFDVAVNSGIINVALEHRESKESDTGYSMSYSVFEHLELSYTNVGDYDSLGFSFYGEF